jgi:hypothetical protein
MACKSDVRQSIYNKVMEELVEGRYTFTRISDNAIQVNGKVDNTNTKAQTREQALAIANELLNRTKKSFYGHVTGYVSNVSAHDPITVSFRVSDAYVNHVYEGLPAREKTDNVEQAKNERDHINSNTGYNTHSQIELFSPEEDGAGSFVKFIQLKQSQLAEYQSRLNKVQVDKRKRDVSTEELGKLNKKERELKLQIEGNFELGIKGLKQEIAQLSKNADTEAITYYVNKDIDRISKLANSSDVDDINEAQRLIDFYDLAGTFRRNVENPFFSQDEMFLEDENGKLTTHFKLSKETMDQYKEWRERATAFQNIINKRLEETTVNTVNSDTSVKKTYGNNKKFSYDELIKDETGLKDTDWISMWTMDITQGIWSNNGILPQVMFSHLANNFEKKLAWTRKVWEKIDELTPKVQKELIRKGYSLRAGGIIGLKGASYQLFKEITKEGNETGGIIQRYAKEFFDEQSKALNRFSIAFDSAKLYDDYTQRSKAFNKVFEDLKRWRRANTIIMDISSIPEIHSDPEFKDLFEGRTIDANDTAHKNHLLSVLGQKGYNEEVEKQKKLLRKFTSDKQSMIETLIAMENKTQFSELSDKAKSDLNYWENNHSPFRGVEDYNAITGIFFGDRKTNNFMDYNNFIPRKNTVNITANQTQNKYSFTDNSNSYTGHHSQRFSDIESSPVLSEFYDTLKEICDTIRESMPYELQQKMAVNSLPALNKTSAEIIADKSTGILSSIFNAYRHMKERLRLSFGVNKQSEISYATTDPITGKTNYKVNDLFLRGNTKAVEQNLSIEREKFLQAYNAGRAKDERIDKLRRFSVLNLDSMNTASLIQLAQYLHLDVPLQDIQARRLDKIRNITGNTVEIGKYIRDFSLHSVVQSQSFDLAKLAKYFSNMTMMYAARQEALPILEIMKQHYEKIQKPKTTNLGRGIYNANDQTYMKAGLRTHAIQQMDDWFERVVLGNFDTKHIGPHGNPTKLQKIIEDYKSKHPKLSSYFTDIYSNEEKKKLSEVNDLIKNEKDPEKKQELEKLKAKMAASMGRTRTATALIDNLLGYVRTLRLGYNISSATTNFMEGVMSNMILAGLNNYFDPKEMFYGYHVIKHSFLKNITFGLAETGLAKKNRSLMDKFNVIMDSKNELQKSSAKTYTDKLSWLDPHALNSRVEYINQSPIMIAMLRTEKIKDKNGKEDTIWNALDNKGHLREDFKTEENIKNWEDLNGEQYLNFKQKLHKAIVLGHGNYDELRGMMIKSNSAGKTLMMFKTWLPMQLYWRFASGQDDIQSGTIGYKGRYLSYGKGTGALHGAAVGTTLFGPIGAIAGAALGGFLGGYFGTDSGVGMLKETLEATKTLAKKVFGFPVNLLAGRQLINTGDKAFESWVGNGKFTEQDARNLRGNMADIAMQLAFLAMMLIVKHLLWDDDDKPDDTRREAHNLLINRLASLSSQASSYVSPVSLYKSTFGSDALIEYLNNVAKEISAVENYFEGKDTIPTGVNAGESKLGNQTSKTFLPGLFKSVKNLGLGTQEERQFDPTPFDDWFKNSETLDKASNKRNREDRRLELEQTLDVNDFEGDTPEDQEKAKKKEVNRILNEELPTPTKLHKLDMTRKEYKEYL